MNYYYIKEEQTYVDYMGVVHIVTEVSKDIVVLVDEEGRVYKENRLDFISECMGSRYFRINAKRPL